MSVSTQMTVDGIIDFSCPISLETFREPHVLKCGHTFERIEIRNINKCPTCRFEVVPGESFPNYALMSAISTVDAKFKEIEALRQAERQADRRETMQMFEEMRSTIRVLREEAVPRTLYDESERRCAEVQRQHEAALEQHQAVQREHESVLERHQAVQREHEATLERHQTDILTLKQNAQERRRRDEKNIEDSIIHGVKVFTGIELASVATFSLLGAAAGAPLMLLNTGLAAGTLNGIIYGLECGTEKYKTTKNNIDREFPNLEVPNGNG
jgi:hypothetical protein